MDISHFNLHSVSFEVRYDQAYLLWDRAGSIWHDIRQTHPKLVLKEANPGKVVMTIEKNTTCQ